MEAKVVLSKLLQNFSISLPDNYKLVLANRITKQPKDVVQCNLEVRKKNEMWKIMKKLYIVIYKIVFQSITTGLKLQDYAS